MKGSYNQNLTKWHDVEAHSNRRANCNQEIITTTYSEDLVGVFLFSIAIFGHVECFVYFCREFMEKIQMKRKVFLMLFVILASAMGVCQEKNFPPKRKDIHIGKTNLPIVFINTLGHEISKDSRMTAWMKIVNNADGINYDDTLAHPQPLAECPRLHRHPRQCFQSAASSAAICSQG